MLYIHDLSPKCELFFTRHLAGYIQVYRFFRLIESWKVLERTKRFLLFILCVVNSNVAK